MTLTIYEVGIRASSGKYSKFLESYDKEQVIEHAEMMKAHKPKGSEIILLEKYYDLVCTTPHIIGADQ